MNEYSVKIIDFPSKTDYEIGVIQVFRDIDGTDLAFRFISPKGEKVYIPLGADNHEPGSNPRQLHWINKDEILSITPSIQIGSSEHFYITENKIVQ